VTEDVTSDPFRCPVMRAAQTLERAQAGGELPTAAAGLGRCIMDRMQRTVAWQQRHEQILNDATQTLARAGDLARPGDAKAPPAPRDPGQEVATPPHADPCQEVFGSTGRAVAGQPSDVTQSKRS
jgi:hypothetical protein